MEDRDLETPSAFHATEKRESGSRCTKAQPLALCSACRGSGTDGGGGGGAITRAGALASNDRHLSGGGGGNGSNGDTNGRRSVSEEWRATDDGAEKAAGADEVMPTAPPIPTTLLSILGAFTILSVLRNGL